MGAMVERAAGDGPVVGSAGPNETISPVKGRTPCLQCGYDLRGLDVERACPECGRPVAASLPIDLSVPANRAYAQRLVAYVSVALVGHAVVASVALLQIASHFLSGRAGLTLLPPGRAALTAHWVGQAATWLVLISWWLLTEPLPKTIRRAPTDTRRNLIRSGIVAMAVVWTAQYFVWLVDASAGMPAAYRLGTTIAFLLAQLALYVPAVFYLRHLAILHASGSVLKRTRSALWALLLIVPLGVFFGSFLPWMSLALLPLLWALHRDLRRRVPADAP